MMRITNAMMTSNTKNNINLNKLNEDRLNTQIATGQVISRPSEDPVVAIRALRLNTNLSQLTQYYKKNIPDSQAWMNVTETALKQTDQVFTSIKENLTTGASDTNTATDRQKILENLKGLRAELYSSGNADYAERTVFTDYRTQKSLTFLETDTDLNENYQIHETFGVKDIESIKYIRTTDSVTHDGGKEQYVEEKDVYRIRLAYDNNDPDKDIPDITLPNGKKITVNRTSIAGKEQYMIDKIYTEVNSGEVNYIPETGELIIGGTVKQELEKAVDTVPLDSFTVDGQKFKVSDGRGITTLPNEDEIFFNPEDGTISMGSKVAESFNAMNPFPAQITLPDGVYTLSKTAGDDAVSYSYDSATKTGKLTLGSNIKSKTDTSILPPETNPRFRSSGDDISVDYNKNTWKSGDLRPEHYFACIQTVNGKNTYYNYDLDANGSPDASRPNFYNKDMEVEISFNQKITINTHANEVYTHDIGRDVDELIKITQDVVDCDEKVSELEKKIAAETDPTTKQTLEQELDAAKKEYSLKKNRMQKMFSGALDTFAGYADRNNLAIANIGSMQSRLTITKERVADQLQSFKELADANINAELTESSIDFANAKLALEAAQLAAGKIAQQTLLNYL